jgi:sugar transferase (PEP-CTERM/EpsH1 system associated)
MSRVYAREARLLEARERDYVESFDATLVIAESEASCVRQFAPRGAARVHVIGNGVDTDYFDPGTSWDDPYPRDVGRIVFTGAMDYRANVDGVVWFANAVLPLIRRRSDRVLFTIVGTRPAPDVAALASVCVEVTGRVADVRPYLAHADVVVAPLRIARGVQNKVLEALAMAKHVVATPLAMQGLGRSSSALVSTATEPQPFADAVLDAHDRPRIVNAAGRAAVLERFSWQGAVTQLQGMFRPAVPSGIARAS